MNTLARQIRRARRRLLVQSFLGLLPWCLFAALLAACVMVGIEKYRPLGIGWPVWLGAAWMVGTLAAVLATFWRRHGVLEAAIEIDRRFGLKERVASAWSLDPETAGSPAGQALLADAARRLDGLDVGSGFRIRPSRWSWLPLAPAAAAFLLALFVPVMQPKQAVATTDPAEIRRVREPSQELRKKLADRRREANEQGLQQAKELFDKLEKSADELSKLEQPDRKQALVKLNDLAKQLEQRQRELEGNKEAAKQLAQLNQLDRGPADRFAKALEQGDFAKAASELEKLKDQLGEGKLTEEEREQLAKQLDQMKEKLQELADAHRAKEEELRRQAEAARAAGREEEAEALEEQLRQMAQPSDNQKRLEQFAEQLGQCSSCLKEGQADAAMEALAGMQGDLEDLQGQLDELEMLDAAMGELADAKGAMNCQECLGHGCELCQGGGMRPGNGGGIGGSQWGRGSTIGEPNNTEIDASSYDTRVRQQVGAGPADVADFIDGPNVAGQIQQDVSAALEAARSEDSDPVTSQRLPRGYRDHTKTYFDALRQDRQ